MELVGSTSGTLRDPPGTRRAYPARFVSAASDLDLWSLLRIPLAVGVFLGVLVACAGGVMWGADALGLSLDSGFLASAAAAVGMVLGAAASVAVAGRAIPQEAPSLLDLDGGEALYRWPARPRDPSCIDYHALRLDGGTVRVLKKRADILLVQDGEGRRVKVRRRYLTRSGEPDGHGEPGGDPSAVVAREAPLGAWELDVVGGCLQLQRVRFDPDQVRTAVDLITVKAEAPARADG